MADKKIFKERQREYFFSRESHEILVRTLMASGYVVKRPSSEDIKTQPEPLDFIIKTPSTIGYVGYMRGERIVVYTYLDKKFIGVLESMVRKK